MLGMNHSSHTNPSACWRVWLEGVVLVSVLGLYLFLCSLAARFCFVWIKANPPSPSTSTVLVLVLALVLPTTAAITTTAAAAATTAAAATATALLLLLLLLLPQVMVKAQGRWHCLDVAPITSFLASAWSNSELCGLDVFDAVPSRVLETPSPSSRRSCSWAGDHAAAQRDNQYMVEVFHRNVLETLHHHGSLLMQWAPYRHPSLWSRDLRMHGMWEEVCHQGWMRCAYVSSSRASASGPTSLRHYTMWMLSERISHLWTAESPFDSSGLLPSQSATTWTLRPSFGRYWLRYQPDAGAPSWWRSSPASSPRTTVACRSSSGSSWLRSRALRGDLWGSLASRDGRWGPSANPAHHQQQSRYLGSCPHHASGFDRRSNSRWHSSSYHWSAGVFCHFAPAHVCGALAFFAKCRTCTCRALASQFGDFGGILPNWKRRAIDPQSLLRLLFAGLAGSDTSYTPFQDAEGSVTSSTSSTR